jgi:hypothetical protein
VASSNSLSKAQRSLASKENDKRTFTQKIFDPLLTISPSSSFSSSSSSSSSSTTNNTFKQTSPLERQINPLPLQSQSEHIPSHIPGTVSQLHQYESQPSLVNELDHVNNQNIPQSFLETSKAVNHSELPLQHEKQIVIQTQQNNQENSSS